MIVESTVTLFIDHQDVDVPMRAEVEVDHRGATLDTVEVFVRGEWTEMDPKLVKHVEDALCEQAIEAERDALCDLDPDHYGDR